MANDENGAGGVDLENIPTEKVLKLRSPLRFMPNDPNPIVELNLSEPTAGQMSKFARAAAKPGSDDIEAGCVFIAENSGVSINSIRLMKSRDFEEALEFLSGFTKAGREALKPT